MKWLAIIDISMLYRMTLLYFLVSFSVMLCQDFKYPRRASPLTHFLPLRQPNRLIIMLAI